MVTLQATHSHFYPGHRGRIAGLAQIADLLTDGDCLVEFADGSAAAATISKSGNDWLLDAGAYRSAAGTDIAAWRWLVRLTQDGDQVEFRILAKTA